MRDRVLDLAREGVPDIEIAAVLTAEGHRSPNCHEKVLTNTVQRIRHVAGIQGSAPRKRWDHESSSLSASELAARLNIPVKQLAHQALRCIFVSSGLDQKVENFTLIIDGTPQVHLPAGD